MNTQNKTQPQNVRINEVFSCVKATSLREAYEDGATKREVILITDVTGDVVIVDYDWDNNKLTAVATREKYVEVSNAEEIERQLTELYEVTDGYEVITIYKLSTLLGDVYIVRYDRVTEENEEAKIVAASTSFAQALKEAEKWTSMPIVDTFFQYYFKKMQELFAMKD